MLKEAMPLFDGVPANAFEFSPEYFNHVPDGAIPFKQQTGITKNKVGEYTHWGKDDELAGERKDLSDQVFFVQNGTAWRGFGEDPIRGFADLVTELAKQWVSGLWRSGRREGHQRIDG